MGQMKRMDKMDDDSMMHLLIITMITIIINSFFLSSTVYKYFCSKKDEKKAKQMVKPVLYSALVSFSGFPICFMLELIMQYNMRDVTSHSTIHWMINVKYSTVWIAFVSARIAFYIFLLFRIYYVFKGTSLQMSKLWIYIHLLIITFTPVCILNMIILQFTISDNSELFLIYQVISMSCSCLCITAVMFGAIHLSVTFNRNVYNMLKSECKKSHNDGHKGKGGNRLMVGIVKHNLLTIITVIMFLSFVLSFGLLSAYQFGENIKLALWYIECITINIATTCIYLGFTVNEFWYYAFCGKCHKMFVSSVEQKLVDYIAESKDGSGSNNGNNTSSTAQRTATESTSVGTTNSNDSSHPTEETKEAEAIEITVNDTADTATSPASTAL